MSLYSRPYNGWYGCVIRKVSPVPAVLTVVDCVLQRPQATHPAAARRGSGGPQKLSAPGKTFDQLTRSVRFLEGPPARPTHDGGWTPLTVPPSSLVQPRSQRQPASAVTLCTIPDYASLSSMRWLSALVDAMFSIFGGYVMRHSPGGGDHSPLRKASSSSSGR